MRAIERVEVSRNAGADHDEIRPFERRFILRSNAYGDGGLIQLLQNGTQFLRILAIGRGHMRTEPAQQPRRRHATSRESDHCDL